MNEAQLVNALSKAQELMNSNAFNSLVESKSKNVSFDPSGNVNVDKRESLSHESLVNEFSNSRSKGIPSEILESFNRQPSPEITTPMDCLMEKLKINDKKEYIKENTQTSNYQSGSIDYSIIKAIVNECLSSQLKTVKESILSESVLRGFTIKEGNKVQFISKSGDLYEGELKLKKKKNR